MAMSFGYKSPSGDNFTFIHRSDLSGDVTIISSPVNGEKKEVDVPGEAILEFVADFVVARKISALEGADTYELLGIPNPY